jgi:hypothetical protein
MGETCSTNGNIERCRENINRKNLLSDLSLETYETGDIKFNLRTK